MKLLINPTKESWANIVTRPTFQADEIKAKVQEILLSVAKQGDKALLDYTKTFDGIELNHLLVPQSVLENRANQIDKSLKKAIDQAMDNIRLYHSKQKVQSEIIETMPGVQCWQSQVPIEHVGLYIPGGSAPLFSTLMMLGIPATIAECPNIVVCTPADKEGNIHPALAYIANRLGIRQVFAVGGAQAIAAMAYGTESIPKVDKIFGPGNRYVTEAKSLLNQQGVAIDMPAGPSEVLVIADETANPEFVAADLLSQAEHGADSQVILLCTSENIAKNCLDKLQTQTASLPRAEIAQKALENSVCIVLNTLEECLELSNLYAPEHLILAIDSPRAWAKKVRNAGSVFIGNFSCESAGDYASGPNHTLPTYGFAKTYSGITLDSFCKRISFQELSEQGLNNIAETVMTLAEAEGLEAHKRAVSIRLNTKNR
jgi:histidinol dehydrogenase